MIIRSLLALLLVPFALLAIATNNVDAEVQWDSIYAETPYVVTLSITHDSESKIDTTSFRANNKIISPTFVKAVKLEPHSSPLEISIYTVEMPGLPQGLQSLPTFSVKMNGTVYSSIPSGFEVKGNGPAKAVSQASPTLKLLAVFTGTEPLYPNQRFFLGYRYLYNTSVDLSEEKLPLLDAKGFKKLGDKQIENGIDQGKSMTQVIQKVESDAPGSYTFPASQITGYAYVLDAKGQKQYDKTPLTSSLPAFEIKVVPFPVKDKPGSFRGAIGSYTFQSKLISSNQVEVGDKIKLLLSITGAGELEQLLAPDLCCQPGFSGFFKPSDLPPETLIKGNTKTFVVDLYVENPDATHVPPVEFSFFNPSTKTYERIFSEEIPLRVSSKALLPPENRQEKETSPVESSLKQPIASSTALPIPITLLGFAGLGLLVFQAHFLHQKKASSLPKISDQLYQEALKQASNQEQFYPLAIRALHQKFKEEPSEEIQELLLKLENTRFSKDSAWDFASALNEFQRIFTA